LQTVWIIAGWLATALPLVGCPPSDQSESEPEWQRAFDAEDVGWLMSIAGRSPEAVYAVGGAPSDGAVRRYDGEEWSDVSVPSELELATWVHCFEDGDPVVAAFGGQVLWREGGGWRVDELPTDADTEIWGVWGASRDDVWAVGGTGDGEPVAFRYDGSDWSAVELPDLEADREGDITVESLFKVWGTGADDVFMVGEQGAIVHWNGDTLEDQSVDLRKDLISVWGSGPDRVVAAGGRTTGELAVWDGSEWSLGSLRPLVGVNGVWVPDSETAWVAGRNGSVARVDVTTDGLDKKVFRLDTDRDFHAIYGLPGEGLYAVGGNLDEPDGPHRGAIWFRNGLD